MMDVFQPTVDEALQKVIRAISQQHLKSDCINRRNHKGAVSKLCSDLKSIIDWDFNFKKFYDILCELPQLPLEIVWNLHIFQIMPFEKYLLNLKSRNNLPKLQEDLCRLSLDSCDDDWNSYFVQTGMLSYLVAEAFSSNKNTDEDIQMICRSIIEHLLRNVFSLKEDEITLERMKHLYALWTCGTLEVSSLHALCCFALHQFLCESEATETDAFAVQENWKRKANPFHLLPVVEKFVEILKPDELKQIFCRSLQNVSTNWKNYIVVVAAINNSNNEVSSILNVIVTTLIKDGFELLKPKSFQRALLIGRQICLKPNVPFAASYGLWFQTNIGDGIRAQNKEGVSLLIQSLCEMIPYEKNIDCIKIFLERPMNVPYECQSIHSDYIALLKTRVKDLQPRINTGHILEKVLNSFQETGKIPPYILEASLMHKHHFLNEFLPALLTPRVIPSVPDVKEKFIEELNKSGKIPASTLQRYKLRCQQEQQKLLADINMGDVNFVEFMDDDIQILN